jgi:hypothetical protein
MAPNHSPNRDSWMVQVLVHAMDGLSLLGTLLIFVTMTYRGCRVYEFRYSVKLFKELKLMVVE